MEELESEAGFRSAYEFYDAEEQKFKKLVEEAHQRKTEVLKRWKEFNNGGKK